MRRTYLAVLGTVLGCGLSTALADEPASDARVVSLMHYIHATQNVDTTTAFYQDVFGMETPPVRFYDGPGAARLNNAPDLVLRLSRPILPGEKYGFEFTEFTHVDRKGGQQALPTDPGAVELIVHVRDLDTVLGAAKKHGAEILSRNGDAVTIGTSMGPARAVLIRDPDGYLVRAIEVPASKASLAGNIQAGTSLGVAVKDLDETVKFYKDVLGFDVTADRAFASNPAMADLVGAPSGSEYRSASATFPGESNARIEFYDWKGMPRTPFQLRVPDPGAGGMVMGVKDLDAIVATVKGLGLATVTPDPIWFTSTIRDIFVKDPNGLNLELYEQVPEGEAN